jgi:hypothetical protein
MEGQAINGILTNGGDKSVSHDSVDPVNDLKAFLKDLLVVLER